MKVKALRGLFFLALGPRGAGISIDRVDSLGYTKNMSHERAYRPLSIIANDINNDYAARGKPVHYSAKPYVDAMRTLYSLDDVYYDDSARSVVLYALSNLTSWRGDTAKSVKAELKDMLKNW